MAHERETISCGKKTIASTAVPEAVINVPTPCFGVWLGAPEDGEGVAANTKTAYVGDASGQSIPILASDFKGFFLKVADASKVYVKAGANGEAVNFAILQ
jgi:hypothetical protein